MSLLRLLTSGKSLVGVRDTETRYRLTTQRLLPQFGSAKNPFSSGGTAEQAPAAAVYQPTEPCEVANRASIRNPARELWRRSAALLGGWKAKLSGLGARPPRKAAKSAIPQFPKPAVQGELSLDRIRVVRNDFSDGDVEIVPANPRSASARQAVEPTGDVQGAWVAGAALDSSRRQNVV
jgi:hypothetical protein